MSIATDKFMKKYFEWNKPADLTIRLGRMALMLSRFGEVGQFEATRPAAPELSNATGSSSTADPGHALDQCRRHHHHDRQRLEDLQ
jgi:hypothetical protein